MIVYGDHQRIVRSADLITRPSLILAGEIAQAMSDARGSHDPSLDAVLLQLAHCDGAPVVPPPLPETLEVSVPEGYAFYAVDPALYARAAESVRHLADEWTVVGIRSIGTSLGAAVAAVLPNASFVTVRPAGHPFARELRPSPYEESVLRAGRGLYAIVDEGPGLSGSSFASVARWLEAHGVDLGRIVFFPSHAHEPGPKATDETRALWRTVRRAHVELTMDGADLGAGKWRSLRFGHEDDWPGVHVQQERRKHLIDGARLAKFTGFGPCGDEMFDRARELADAGFAPPVLEQRRGFTISRWIGGARTGVDFDTVARYLCFRERWPAERRGASARQLLDMACFNTGRRWPELEPLVDEIDERARPIVTDNKMQRWEWIATPSGAFLKTDGVDHHAAHDLIGCQDLAWDAVGAMIELDAPQILDALGHRWPPHVVHFYEVCYRAFWYGYSMLAAESCPDEAPRLRREAARYFTPFVTQR